MFTLTNLPNGKYRIQNLTNSSDRCDWDAAQEAFDFWATCRLGEELFVCITPHGNPQLIHVLSHTEPTGWPAQEA